MMDWKQVISSRMLNSSRTLRLNTSLHISHLMRSILIRPFLVKEASEALKASESCVTMLQEELMALKHNCMKLTSIRLLAKWCLNMRVN